LHSVIEAQNTPTHPLKEKNHLIISLEAIFIPNETSTKVGDLAQVVEHLSSKFKTQYYQKKAKTKMNSTK
jgi:hypothetical protein